MKKWIIRIVLGVTTLIIIGIVIVYLSLNSIIRSAVERQASASLNVPTTLGGVQLSLFGGSLSLTDLIIGSPPDYTAPHMFTLGGASVNVHYGELTGSPIHISKISIDSPDLFIEQKNLKLNIDALNEQKSQTPQTSSGQATQPVKVIIDELDVTNAQVTFMPGLPGLSTSVPVSIPSLTLKNIGNADGNNNGVEIKAAVMQVVSALASQAGQAGNLPGELKGMLTGSLTNITQQLGQGVQGIVGTAGKLIGGDNSGANGSTTQPSDLKKGLLNNLPKFGQ